MIDTNSANLQNRKILISGAGAAGQTLAYWLRQHGFTPVVVERAPEPRAGGFAIDIRGAAVFVAKQMGILEDCREVSVRMREIVRVNREGGHVWKTDGNFGAGDGVAGDVEILRDDLTHIIQQKLCEGIEYRFGDSITAIAQDESGVAVTFRNGDPERFDLVIGADGLHSNVRALAFGPEEKFAKPLGYYIAIFTIDNFMDLEQQWHMCYLPGKMANIMQYGLDKHTRAMFLFASPPLDYDRGNADEQKALINQAFLDDNYWVVPQLLEQLQAANDLYFDEVTQIHMPGWSNGRVALTGDAACAPTAITGQGTSLALVGSYVLAGELKAAGGNYKVAFERCNSKLQDFVKENQDLAFTCEELAIPDTWEDLYSKEELFSNIQEDEDEEPDERSAAYLFQKAANAITLDTY
tara:strand:+ start:262 stop:1491 length:1230 start_codon:yes stop_codon:yes gene_type:complete